MADGNFSKQGLAELLGWDQKDLQEWAAKTGPLPKELAAYFETLTDARKKDLEQTLKQKYEDCKEVIEELLGFRGLTLQDEEKLKENHKHNRPEVWDVVQEVLKRRRASSELSSEDEARLKEYEDEAGVRAIMEEVLMYGEPSDKECLRYILFEKAGDSEAIFSECHAKTYMDYDINSRKVTDERTGKQFDYFCEHKKSKNAKLKKAHVLALRLFAEQRFKPTQALRMRLCGASHSPAGPCPLS